MLASLFHRFFERLRPHERAVLDELSDRLPEAAQSILLSQLERVNKVQRHADGREVNLYCMKGGKAFLDESLRFPNGNPELLLATARVKSSGLTKPLRAEVWMSNGRVFSVVFNQSPKDIGDDAEVSDLIVLADPMKPCVDGALTAEERERLVAAIDAKLPDEYLALVADGKGAVINGWHVYDVPEMRKIVQPDRNFYLVAEKEGRGAIGVAEEDQFRQLYYLDYEDEVPVRITTSLRAFLEREQSSSPATG